MGTRRMVSLGLPPLRVRRLKILHMFKMTSMITKLNMVIAHHHVLGTV